MRKAALLMSLMVVSAVAGGSFAYGWYSVTNVSPHNNPTAAPVTPSTPETDIAATQYSESVIRRKSSGVTAHQPSMRQQLSHISNKNGEISLTLDEPQLTQLVNDAILSQPVAAQLLANAQLLQTTLQGEFIETGAVLNLSELPREALSTELQTSLDQLTSAVPMLTNRDIYIGIVARPQIQDGKITLNQDLSFKIGQFTLPLADVAEQMGFSTSEIEQRLNGLLDQQGVILETIEILDEQLVITGIKS
ncbi:hypothetical protein SPB21_22905 [Leptothoe sp. ISB3NOV94-8A]|nr:hypothetical protein [Adonisia turfae]MDV3352305.1 hypothetical protein [Leptothoe sp. LEGE 181152]